jgi:hypothetical protein
VQQYDAFGDDQVQELAVLEIAAVKRFSNLEGARPDIGIGLVIWR